MRKIINIPRSIEFELSKKYIPVIIKGKFIILTDSQILILKKPIVTNRRCNGKKYIYSTKNTIYKISTLPLKDEIMMQILTTDYVNNSNIKVKIPKIKWWSNYNNITIIAMEKAPAKKFKNNPKLYKRIQSIANELNKHNIYHNDWHKGNILYDDVADDLWLIDFGEATTTPNRITNLTKFLA